MPTSFARRRPVPQPGPPRPPHSAIIQTPDSTNTSATTAKLRYGIVTGSRYTWMARYTMPCGTCPIGVSGLCAAAAALASCCHLHKNWPRVVSLHCTAGPRSSAARTNAAITAAHTRSSSSIGPRPSRRRKRLGLHVAGDGLHVSHVPQVTLGQLCDDRASAACRRPVSVAVVA